MSFSLGRRPQLLRVSAIACGLMLFVCRAGAAQAPVNFQTGRANATRHELEQLAANVDPAISESIQARLREGDFRAGDQLLLVIRGDSTFNDTVIVSDGPTLRVLSLPEDSLRGVLRSELQAHLTSWITRFYKNASVQATPLIRFGVLGEVNHPGYYRLPIDIALSDAIMAAGGPTQRADMPRTVVRRRSLELVSRAAVRDAMVAGLTLDRLGVEAGDELVVGAKPDRGWMTIVQIGTLITGLALSVQALRGF